VKWGAESLKDIRVKWALATQTGKRGAAGQQNRQKVFVFLIFRSTVVHDLFRISAARDHQVITVIENNMYSVKLHISVHDLPKFPAVSPECVLSPFLPINANSTSRDSLKIYQSP